MVYSLNECIELIVGTNIHADTLLGLLSDKKNFPNINYRFFCTCFPDLSENHRDRLFAVLQLMV